MNQNRSKPLFVEVLHCWSYDLSNENSIDLFWYIKRRNPTGFGHPRECGSTFREFSSGSVPKIPSSSLSTFSTMLMVTIRQLLSCLGCILAFRSVSMYSIDFFVGFFHGSTKRTYSPKITAWSTESTILNSECIAVSGDYITSGWFEYPTSTSCSPKTLRFCIILFSMRKVCPGID